MRIPFPRLFASALVGLPLLAAHAQTISTPSSAPDPIPQAPEALETARASLVSSRKVSAHAAEGYAAILILRQVAEAYAAKSDTRQSVLYYQECLRLLGTLSKIAPSFQPTDVAREVTEITTALKGSPGPAPLEKTLQLELTRAYVQDGHLKVEWKVSPPDMTVSEIEKHLDFTIAIKLKDGSTVKKPKLIENLFIPSPTGESDTYLASQDYICPSTVQSVLLEATFFDVNVFQQNQVLP